MYNLCTMTFTELTESFTRLSAFLKTPSPALRSIKQKTYYHNNWFTEENIDLALNSIADNFLDEEKIATWLNNYPGSKDIDFSSPQIVGLVMAGNIPLVGFHDLLCVLFSGNKAMIKLSSKDNILLPFIAERLFEFNPKLKDYIIFTGILKNINAVIATGSNNSARYFEYYFKKYPHIIRRNRGSVSVLTGSESKDDILNLGNDIFEYFGLGCRNVSKLYVPYDYDFTFFLDTLEPYKKIREHGKYMNNYDYNRTILIMNKVPHLASDFLMLSEDERVVSPVASLHYEFYTDENDLKLKLEKQAGEIQCIVGKFFPVPFGKTQQPQLWDYADNVDTMKFILSVKNYPIQS